MRSVKRNDVKGLSWYIDFKKCEKHVMFAL
jgi:hypothetical protein